MHIDADTYQTKKFYVNFLGLKLTKAFIIDTTKTSKHKSITFFLQLKRWFSNCFFEDPSSPFKFIKQRDFDLRIARGHTKG